MRTESSHRFSESAVPEKLDPEFALPSKTTIYGTRNSLVSFEPSTKENDGGSGFVDYSGRDSCTSDASGFEPMQFWTLEEDAEASLTPSNAIAAAVENDPYHGISIEVNNHSINNQGVVMYHVDIKGPSGLLSTYTIRRRYRAFKNLYTELANLMGEYSAACEEAAAATAANNNRGDSNNDNADVSSGANIPLSPHSQTVEKISKPPISASLRTFTLPALPSAGVWSYLKRHDVRLVEQRKKRFQEILRLAIRHPATKHSPVLDTFLSVAPSQISQRGGSSYVSLQDYSVPVFDRQRESIERRQWKLRVLEGRRQRTGSEASSSQS